MVRRASVGETRQGQQSSQRLRATMLPVVAYNRYVVFRGTIAPFFQISQELARIVGRDVDTVPATVKRSARR